jgi:hypothetical protein
MFIEHLCVPGPLLDIVDIMVIELEMIIDLMKLITGEKS